MHKAFFHWFILLLCFSVPGRAQELYLEDCFLEGDITRPTNRIIEDHYGFIWWMREEGFFRFDGKVGTFIDPVEDSPDVTFYSTANVLSKPNGDYWFAARELGLVHYDAQKDISHNITTFNDGDTSLHLYSRHVCELPTDDSLKMVSGTNGVWQLDKVGNFQKRLQPALVFGQSRWRSFNANEVRKTIYDRKRNRLWIGGMVGLLSYDFDTEQLVQHFTSFH